MDSKYEKCINLYMANILKFGHSSNLNLGHPAGTHHMISAIGRFLLNLDLR